jgi:WXG100 family type VII secretion target
MNYTDVDADRVLSVKAQIANDIANIKKTQNTLKTQIISSLSPYWQGPAFESFTQQFNAFLTAIESYAKSCETLNGELDKAGRGYNGADAEVRRLVAGLPN